ncbi:MAG: Dipeptide transport system permease protein DppC [Candidatus Omnitrophica bacterium]|nr:Dipeptide transport system permease protein DppC [Candidatus Omnitrophota bacterium]
MRGAVAWLIGVVLAAIVAPLGLGEVAQRIDLQAALLPPGPGHWLGTDGLGRDLLARLLVGTTASLGVAVLSTAVATIVGVLIGATAGLAGGRVERALLGLIDLTLCFPAFFLILAVVAMLGPGLTQIAVIIGLVGWTQTARLVRAEILSLKERDFVAAARVLGAGWWRICRVHLLPNASGPVIVSAVLGLSSALLVEGGLSFLGIGVQPPVPSWGNLLMDGRSCLGVAWWMTLFPGLMIFLTVLSANVVAERISEPSSIAPEGRR